MWVKVVEDDGVGRKALVGGRVVLVGWTMKLLKWSLKYRRNLNIKRPYRIWMECEIFSSKKISTKNIY